MLITVSKNSNKNCREFARDFSNCFPSSLYISRGKSSLKKIMEKARFQGKKILLVIELEKNQPRNIKGIKLSNQNFDFVFDLKIKVLKTRKSFSKIKKLPEIKVNSSTKDFQKFIELLEIKEEKDSEFELREKNNVISCFFGKEEIGPKFEILDYDFYEK